MWSGQTTVLCLHIAKKTYLWGVGSSISPVRVSVTFKTLILRKHFFCLHFSFHSSDVFAALLFTLHYHIVNYQIGVVHMTGGLSALLAIHLMGARDGVTFSKGRRDAPEGQSAAFQTIGALSLWFGWFGFNGCSVGALVGNVTVAARAMVMTVVSASMSALVTFALMLWFNDGHVHISQLLNGILSGLVAITANCATVRLEGAMCIGIVSGITFITSNAMLERFHIDDVVQAAAVHYFAGTWGIIAAGFFTAPRLYEETYLGKGDDFDDLDDASNDDRARDHCCGVLYGCHARQLGVNIIFVLVHLVWVVLTAGGFFYLLHRKKLLRVPKLEELVGLDTMYHSEQDQHQVNKSMEMTIGGVNDMDSSNDSSRSHSSNRSNNLVLNGRSDGLAGIEGGGTIESRTGDRTMAHFSAAGMQFGGRAFVEGRGAVREHGAHNGLQSNDTNTDSMVGGLHLLRADQVKQAQGRLGGKAAAEAERNSPSKSQDEDAATTTREYGKEDNLGAQEAPVGVLRFW